MEPLKNSSARTGSETTHIRVWPEPFGLVMIEAMACGTPVIAFSRGSVPEIMEDGVTGYIVEDEVGAVNAVSRLDQLSRKQVRREFMARFTARRMAEDYVALYRNLAQHKSTTDALLIDAAD